jgi:hypothetical protein
MPTSSAPKYAMSQFVRLADQIISHSPFVPRCCCRYPANMRTRLLQCLISESGYLITFSWLDECWTTAEMFDSIPK